MGAPNNVGKRGTGTREKIVEATREVMFEEGYAAATSRRVADRAGVQRAMVHYYFPSMDDLYLAVLRQGTEENLQAQRHALSTANPLHALWDMTVDPKGARILLEFMALGNHREAIRAELAAGAERFREIQVAALAVILGGRSGDALSDPEVVSVLMSVIGRSIGLEVSLGITYGHDRTLTVLGEYLARLEATNSADHS